MSNYAIEKELDHATGIDPSDFIALKAEVDKLGIKILTYVSTSLNNKSRCLDVGQIENCSCWLKKIKWCSK